jgi:hypothetical protein
MSAHIALTSAAVSLSAGVYGYAKTKSRPSLLGGIALSIMFASAGTLISKTLTAMKDSTRNNVAGIAYIDGATETTWLKQALVTRVDGNNCAPLVRK